MHLGKNKLLKINIKGKKERKKKKKKKKKE